MGYTPCANRFRCDRMVAASANKFQGSTGGILCNEPTISPPLRRDGDGDRIAHLGGISSIVLKLREMNFSVAMKGISTHVFYL